MAYFEPYNKQIKGSLIKLLTRLLLVGSPLVAFLLFVEFQLANYTTTYQVKHEAIKNQGQDCKLLILGSSHGLRGINPMLFDLNAINLANVSQTLELDLALLKHYLPALPNLKVVILPVSYFTLFERLDEVDPARLYFYKRYQGVNMNNQVPFGFPDVSYTALFGPRMAVRMAFSPDLRTKDIHDNGFLPTKMATADLVDYMGRWRVSAHHSAMRMKNFQYNIALLDSIFSVCTQNQVELVLTTLPVHKHYLQAQDERFRFLTDSVTTTFSFKNKVSYIWLEAEEGYSDSCFSDVDHLSTLGAKKASLHINSAIKRIYKDRLAQAR